MGPAFLRKYGVASASGTHIRIPMPVFDDPNLFAGSGDWTPVAGDVKVSIDGGVEANIGTLPTFVNGAWQYVFTALEWTGKSITVRIHDAAGDEVADQYFVIETFGHASAMYAVDFSTREVTLADDAIKAATFDESTAFPLKANDAGSTQVARTGADGDTLETLSAQLDDLPTVAEFEARTLAAAAYFDPAVDKVIPIDVDGITFASAVEIMLAVLAGVAVPSGSTVAFKKRDGTTTKLTITYGTNDGERTVSAIS